jgi:prevent-host-death family protein
MVSKRRAPLHARMISATEAAKSFGRLIEQVRSERAEYIVERSGTPAVRIVPASASRFTASDLIALLKSITSADEAYLTAVEAGVAAFNKPSVPANRWGS